MKQWKIFITPISFLFSINLYAGELDVTVANPPENAYFIANIKNKITLGNTIPMCSMIGGTGNFLLKVNSVNSNGRNGVYYLAIQNSEVTAQEVCAGEYTNYKIYKTNVDGIGVSYNDADGPSESYGKPIALWPQLTRKFSRSGSAMGVGMHVDMRLWRYSSTANTLPFGVYDVTGLTVIQGIGPASGDTLNECNTEKLVASDTTICLTDRRTPKVVASLYSSTCEFVNASKTVQMGTHNMHSSTAQGAGTPWVDASFQLRCSNAWGYGADTTDLNNLTKNNTVKVTVHPLDGFSNANQGIIKLDGSGAQGVGVQLAWGDYSTQGTTPGNPVKLDTPTDANTLSSNFAAGPYAIGGNAVSGDGSIKMAARFIRTSGTFSPGPAKAKVEILANYQ